MKKWKLHITIFSLVILSFSASGQDYQFTQFYANPLYLNPAFAGLSRDIRVVSNFRVQWPNTPSMFISSSTSVDMSLGNETSGVGLRIGTDNQASGVYQTKSLTGYFAHDIKLSDNGGIALGLETGVFQKTIDWNKLTYEDQIDVQNGFLYPTAEEFGRPSFTAPDIGAGVLLYDKGGYAGLTLYHLNTPSEGFTLDEVRDLPMRWVLHIGKTFAWDVGYDEELLITPHAQYQWQGGFKERSLGFNIGTDFIKFGGWYRVGSAAMFSMLLKVHTIQAGYSHDFSLGNGAQNSGGAHEVSLLWRMKPPNSSRGVKGKRIKCPDFYLKSF